MAQNKDIQSQHQNDEDQDFEILNIRIVQKDSECIT